MENAKELKNKTKDLYINAKCNFVFVNIFSALGAPDLCLIGQLNNPSMGLETYGPKLIPISRFNYRWSCGC